MSDIITMQAKSIRKHFFNPDKMELLKGINLQVHQGETIAIMGRSGEGKSTLLQILGTLDSPCQGEISILGKPVTFASRSYIRNKHLAFIFQSFHLLEDYSTLDNVLMPAKIGRTPTAIGTPMYQRALRLLEHVGLSERAHFSTKLLSGGEKQRAAIARALCNDPDIILADEPSGNLDKQTANIIHSLLLGFAKEHNKSLVVVTHDQELADLCDTTYHLVNGVLYQA